MLVKHGRILLLGSLNKPRQLWLATINTISPNTAHKPDFILLSIVVLIRALASALSFLDSVDLLI